MQTATRKFGLLKGGQKKSLLAQFKKLLKEFSCNDTLSLLSEYFKSIEGR